jgi:hypothetical protein
MILFLLPVSDWTSPVMNVYVGNAQISHSAIVDHLVSGLTCVLAGVRFKILNTSRWHEKELCIDRCGILDAIHLLGGETYDQFLLFVDGPSAGGKWRPSMNVAGGALPSLLDATPDTSGRAQEGPDDVKRKPDTDIGEVADTTEARSRNRRVAGAWWRSRPLAFLVVLRLLFEPLRATGWAEFLAYELR